MELARKKREIFISRSFFFKKLMLILILFFRLSYYALSNFTVILHSLNKHIM